MSGSSIVGFTRAVRIAFFLMLVALVSALLAAWLHPRKPSWVRSGEVALVTAAAWSDVLWMDARAPEAFSRGHIPDAKNLTMSAWDTQLESVLQAWKPEMRVVVYCDGHGCETSHEVAARLRSELGLENVYVLTGGWEVWREQHLEAVR